ncbi:MAG TPA: RHS repeat-associated core domain-containing protein [Pyrinomonadaceae bacterium]|jgi:RHS repeat-associated protein|nr:RHS repeat-associated core domain-containing protein [Pyrinomonadaceae bacterium]
MSHDSTSPNQSTNPFSLIHQPTRNSRRLHFSIAVGFAAICLAFASKARAQNVQYDDKALDLGSRSAVRVDPTTRGLNFEIPLGSYPGRAGLNVPVTLSYTSKVWNVEFEGYNDSAGTGGPQPFTIVVARFAKHSVAGWTSSIGMPIVDNGPNHQHLYNQIGDPKIGNTCLLQCWTVERNTIWMPDGSGHEVRATDQPRLFAQDPPADNFYSVDESRMRYQVSTGTLFLPDGSRYLLNSSQYIDRNGNKLTYSNGAWTDTLGRQILNPLPYTPGTSPAVGDQNVPLPGVGGPSINYVLKWRNLSDVLTTPQSLRYVGSTGCPPEISGPYTPALFGWDSVTRTCIGNAGVLFNPVVLHQVVLPTGQTYTFTYNVYGEIDKVALPTGGYERYEYGQVSPLTFTTGVYPQGNRGVMTRIISPSGLGTDEAVWTYSGGFGTATIVGPAPESKRVELSFWTDQNGSWGYSPNGARAGRVYDERTYNAAGQMLSRKMTDWAMTGSSSSSLPGTELANRHARPIREVEFLLDTGGNALAKTTTFAYDTTYQFTVGVELSSISVYDFVDVDLTTAQTLAITSLNSIPNGTLLRRTSTNYLTGDQNYRDRNLLGLPTSVSVYDGSDVLMSQTTYSYDEASYPLINVGSPPYTGWTDPETSVRGNLTTTAFWLNTSGTFLQTHTQYDQFGNLRNSWDARQNLTQANYSSAYAFAYPTQTTSADPDGAGPSVALVATTEYDFTTGRTTATIDANNQRTTFAYNDPLNRLKQVVQASTDEVAKTQTTYIYDDTNRTITVTRDQNTYNDNVIKNQSLFDGLGRVVEQRQYETATDYVTVKTEYDILGRTYKSSNPYRFGEDIAWTITEYDLFSRAISVTTPDGAAVRTAYAGDRFLITDQAGKQRMNRVDAIGQLRDVWEVTVADGATEAISFPSHPEVSAGYRTSYQYDAVSNLVKVSQGSQQRFFMYDSLRRLIRARNPEQSTLGSLALSDPTTGNSAWSTAFEYDTNGNLTMKTDARGVESTYVYDALNRNTSVNYSNTTIGNPDVPDITRFYDGATNGKGRFWYSYKAGNLSVGDNVEHTAIDSYDALGRPLVQRQLSKVSGTWSPTYQISRAYNRAGAVTSQTYPSGHTVTYSYDSAGRTSSFTGNLGDGTSRTYSNNITYSPFGGLTKEQFGTNTAVYNKLHYNVRGQLFDVRVSNVSDAIDEWGGELGALVNYYSTPASQGGSGPDNNGNVLMSQTIVNSYYMEDRYSYDALNRLADISEWQNGLTNTGRQQYDYDRYGNRTINAAQTWGTGINNKQFAVDTATNRLGVPNGQNGTMSYDAAGNLINDTYTGAGSREYDAENRMTRAWGGNNQWQEYTYNADGQRMRRKVDGQEMWQIYGMDGELLAEYSANGPAASPQKEYGYRNGQLLITAEPAPPSSSLGPNFAASSNGAVASASSTYPSVTPGNTINGDHVGSSGWWADNTDSAYPDLLQVDFSGSKTINEIDVFGVQQNYGSPVEPTLTMTSSYALTNFQVQYWKDGAWATVPGGSVTGNDKVWRRFKFAPVTTTKIQVQVTNVAGDNHSQVVEIEAYGPVNVAAASNGAVASASSTYPSVTPGNTINGDHVGSSGWWADNTDSAYPDSLQVDFSGSKTISEIDVFGLQQNYSSPVEPTLTMTSSYALTNFQVQYWKDGVWATVPGGSVTGNDKVWRKFSFAPVTTTKIQVQIAGVAGDNHSQVVEIEAYDKREGLIQWLVTDHLGTPRMIVDQTGILASVKRHDYLPFGEELFAGVGGRSSSLGYMGDDGVRQQFTAHDRDNETGLDYFNARFYASAQGRFVSPDSLLTSGRVLQPQSWNRYAYVLNKPLRLIDPSGLVDCTPKNPCYGQIPESRWRSAVPLAERATVNVPISQEPITTTDVQPITELQVMTGQANPIPQRGAQAKLLDAMADGLDGSGGMMGITVAAPSLGGVPPLVGAAVAFGAITTALLIDLTTSIDDVTPIPSPRTNDKITVYHYTTVGAQSFASGLWPGSSATDHPWLTAESASVGLGIPPPTLVYPVTFDRQTTRYIMRVVPPNRYGAGGLTEYYFPAGTSPGTVGVPVPVPSFKKP